MHNLGGFYMTSHRAFLIGVQSDLTDARLLSQIDLSRFRCAFHCEASLFQLRESPSAAGGCTGGLSQAPARNKANKLWSSLALSTL